MKTSRDRFITTHIGSLPRPPKLLALIQTKHYALAVFATLYVAVAIYYYFKIVRSMFNRDAEESAPALAGSFGLRVALALSGIATLGIGLYPEPFLQFAQRSLFR